MQFAFTIRKIKRVLDVEKTLAARGADRFAAGRVKELTKAIEVLSAYQPAPPPRPKPKARLSTLISHLRKK